MRKLQQLGNTVVVVEHDEEIMRAADYLIDVGPEAGRHGGEIIYQGDVDKLMTATDSYNAVRYLNGELSIPVPARRRKMARLHRGDGVPGSTTLKNIDVKFPLGVMTVVTGVSGSGKSTLVRDILYRAMVRHLGNPCDAPGLHRALGGDLNRISAVEFVDQNPIGKSSRK